MSVRRSRAFVGIAFAIGALLISWLLTAENSPFYDYFLFHGGLRNLWGMLNFIPFMAVLILTRGQMLPELFVTVLAISAQWFLIGYLVAGLFVKNSNQVTEA